jgi:hypothetical protein
MDRPPDRTIQEGMPKHSAVYTEKMSRPRKYLEMMKSVWKVKTGLIVYSMKWEKETLHSVACLGTYIC